MKWQSQEMQHEVEILCKKWRKSELLNYWSINQLFIELNIANELFTDKEVNLVFVTEASTDSQNIAAKQDMVVVCLTADNI